MDLALEVASFAQLPAKTSPLFFPGKGLHVSLTGRCDSPGHLLIVPISLPDRIFTEPQNELGLSLVHSQAL